MINIIGRYEFPNSNFIWEACEICTESGDIVDTFDRIYGNAGCHELQFISDHKSNRIDVVVDGSTTFLSPTQELEDFIYNLVQGNIR